MCYNTACAGSSSQVCGHTPSESWHKTLGTCCSPLQRPAQTSVYCLAACPSGNVHTHSWEAFLLNIH